MTPIQAILLGLVEGITEFLPVSSTAHLLVVEKLMGGAPPSIFFNTVVQLGALGAVIIYFWRRILRLTLDVGSYLTALLLGKLKFSLSTLPMGINILIATIPVFIVGFVAREQIAEFHNSMVLIAFTSVFVAFLLWYGERIAKKDPKAQVGARELLSMGMYQILALIPGVSRSGIVMVGGLMQGLSFEKVLEYAFLMSIPSLGGAGVFELLSAMGDKPTSEIVSATFIGFIASFISALIAIRFLLSLVRRCGFLPFVYYRVLFGIVAFLSR